MKRALILLILGFALTASAQTNPPKATPATKSPAYSASDIAAAKASHKVWVNLDTGVYHKGGRWYGKTKNGKFMTADDAKKAGYQPAKRD
ncbi:MAG TPA: hypothetical protein VLX60_14895 [Terriglobales bacterium]|nr:hypothetical protein [Terriglobales bacterium]